jgi:hypothetical protein
MADGSNKSARGILTVIGVVVFFVIVFNVFKGNPGHNSSSSGSGSNTTDQEDNSGVYKLKFSDTFNRAVASQDDLGVSIVIALDCSGSMADKLAASSESTPKYKIAAESLSEVVAFLENFYKTKIRGQGIALKLGLLRFNSEVKVLYKLSEMDDKHFSEIKAITAQPELFSPDGKTAIGETLKVGTEMLAQSGTIFKSLIIITDGENTYGEQPDTVLQAIVDSRNNKSTKDFPVFTNSILVSFVGFDVESDTFSNLKGIGSRVMSAANKTALDDSLKNLFLADITKLEAK